MASIKEIVEVDYIAKTDRYNKEVNEATKETNEFEKSADGADKSLTTLNASYLAVAGAVGGFVVVMNEASNAVLTNSLNQAELQSNLQLTDEEFKELEKSINATGKAYGFNSQEVARMSALNSEYIETADGVATANRLVAQTATLYALKEGDLAASTDQAVTAQEALRDVVLTGATGAFEDAAINLDSYSEALLVNGELTNAQAKAVEGLVPGTYEYVEALSKASTEEQRFNALAQATNEEFIEMQANMSIAGKAALQWKQLIVTLQNALFALMEALVLVVGGIILWTTVVLQASGVTQLLRDTLSLLVDIIKVLLPYFVLLAKIITVVQVLILKGLVVILNILIQLIESKLLPVLEVWINLLVTKLIPVFVQLIKVVAVALIPVLQILYDVLIALVIPIFRVLWDVLINLIVPVIKSLAEIFLPLLVASLNALGAILNGIILPLLDGLFIIFEAIIGIVEKLATVITNTLVAAFEALSIPLEFIIGLFTDLLNIITAVTDAILGGLIGAFNSIPFVPNIDTGSAQASSSRSSAGGQVAPSNINTRNNNITYNVTTQEVMTLSRALRDQRLSPNLLRTF